MSSVPSQSLQPDKPVSLDSFTMATPPSPANLTVQTGIFMGHAVSMLTQLHAQHSGIEGVDQKEISAIYREASYKIQDIERRLHTHIEAIRAPLEAVRDFSTRVVDEPKEQAENLPELGEALSKAKRELKRAQQYLKKEQAWMKRLEERVPASLHHSRPTSDETDAKPKVPNIKAIMGEKSLTEHNIETYEGKVAKLSADIRSLETTIAQSAGGLEMLLKEAERSGDKISVVALKKKSEFIQLQKDLEQAKTEVLLNGSVKSQISEQIEQATSDLSIGKEKISQLKNDINSKKNSLQEITGQLKEKKSEEKKWEGQNRQWSKREAHLTQNQRLERQNVEHAHDERISQASDHPLSIPALEKQLMTEKKEIKNLERLLAHVENRQQTVGTLLSDLKRDEKQILLKDEESGQKIARLERRLDNLTLLLTKKDIKQVEHALKSAEQEIAGIIRQTQLNVAKQVARGEVKAGMLEDLTKGGWKAEWIRFLARQPYASRANQSAVRAFDAMEAASKKAVADTTPSEKTAIEEERFKEFHDFEKGTTSLDRRAGVIGLNGIYRFQVAFSKAKIRQQMHSFQAQRLSEMKRTNIEHKIETHLGKVVTNKMIPLNEAFGCVHIC